MAVTLDDLVGATRRLRTQPLDHGAWLEVAALLAALGSVDDAELAFATIGEGARVGGQVALAVACARHLTDLGSVRGGELLDQIIETYAERKQQRAKTAPPTMSSVGPGGSFNEAAPIVAEAATPLEDARLVVERLGAWLGSRKPPKVIAPLLSALSKSGARALVGVMTVRPIAAGTTIIEIGEPAQALYWLAHGTVQISRGLPDSRASREAIEGQTSAGKPDPENLGELHSGAFFGEIALVGGTRRTARVTASTDCWVLEIPARAIETAAQKQPKLADVLAAHARRRMLANLVRTSELFQALGEDHRDALLDKFTTELVGAGTTFITEGAANEHLWVLASGRCEVKTAGASIAELGPGAAVGEISLVSGAAAVADVTAIEPVVLLRLSRADFDAVAKQHPELLAEVKKLVVERETANRALFQDASDLIV